MPANGLAFTWCQVPIVYRLDDAAEPAVTISWDDGKSQKLAQLALPADVSSELFLRSGRIRQLAVTISPDALFTE